MRLLVVTTARGFTMSARLLAMLGAAIAERGTSVTFVCCRRSVAEAELARRFPQVPRRTVSARSAFVRALQLRRIATATRATAALVHTDRDLAAAALAMGRRGGVVRRVAIGERVAPSWRLGFAHRRARCLLFGDDVAQRAHVERHVRTAVAWPRPGMSTVPSVSREAGVDAPVPSLAIVTASRGGAELSGAQRAAQHADSAVALRAAARLRTRHPDLQVRLVGDIADLQALRLHAGSLGLADHLAIAPLDALLSPGPFDAAAVWVTAQGDEGAIALAAAMMRRIPAVVPRGADTEALVAPRITGFAADDTDLSGTIAALAHLLADRDDYAAMGTAAAARAERLHGWDAYVDRTVAALARVQAA